MIEALRLVRFIDEHGFDAWPVLGTNGALLGVEGVYTLDGETYREESTIRADMGAVRDWLGY